MTVVEGVFNGLRSEEALRDIQRSKEEHEKLLDTKFQKLYSSILEDLEIRADSFGIQIFREYLGEDRPFGPSVPSREVKVQVIKLEKWYFSIERQALFAFNNLYSPWNFANLTRLNPGNPEHRKIFSSPDFMRAIKKTPV